MPHLRKLLLFCFSFLEAGADIIGTVTYQSSIPGFERHFNVTADEAKELIKTGKCSYNHSCYIVVKIHSLEPICHLHDNIFCSN